MKRAGLLLALAIVACGGAGAPKVKAPPASTSKRPYKLVVSIVVDQLSGWEMRARLPLLPKDGGFARLAREGAYYTRATYPHLDTDTAPGNAALYTGVPAGKSGVFSNEVVLPSGAIASVYRDEETQIIGAGDAGKGLKSSSARRLRVPTVADQFRTKFPAAKIVTLSLKDRGAIPGGGSNPTVALWFDAKSARMVTSSAFAKALPPWLDGKNAVDKEVYGRPWTMANDEWVKSNAPTKDGAPGEGNMAGLGTVFPHPVTHGEFFGLAFRTTPYGDEYLLSLARDAIDHEKLGEGPSLLAVSLSSHDYIGHVFGPDSWEAWDELYRLDTELGKFLGFLDSRFGADGYAVLLSADHGITSLPEMRTSEASDAPCKDESCDEFRKVGSNLRFYPEELKSSLDKLMRAELSVAEPLVLGIAEPYVVLTPRGKELLAAPENDAAFERVHEKWIHAYKEQIALLSVRKGVAVCRRREAEQVHDSPDWTAMCETFDLAGGEFFIRTNFGAILDSGYVPGFGTNHGTSSPFDREVPIFARAPKSWQGGKQVVQAQPISIFARDLRTVLGL